MSVALVCFFQHSKGTTKLGHHQIKTVKIMLKLWPETLTVFICTRQNIVLYL